MASNVAIYARVSSEQQAESGTIRSQIAALLERVKADSYKVPAQELQFIDDGYSGANLVRPALERLRDAAYNGAIDRLYIHSPDRLARKYAYQIVLMDELSKSGVEVVFLNREIGKTPEDDLLLQVQGMMAEYERAKILERSRRGKLQGAKRGAVNVLSGAPYGYKYVGKHESDGDARYEIVFEEARVVQQVFDWVGKDRMSLGEVRRRLEESGAKTRSGKSWWDRTTVWGMLKNPAYMGQAAFGKTKIGEKRSRLRPQRNSSSKPRQSYSTYDVPQEDWITVPVPALVSAELFAAVQEQLTENRSRARERRRGATHLLQGLVCCKYCDYAFYGKPAKNRHGQHYVYYRCIGTDAYRFGGKRVCSNRQVRGDLLEDAVWAQVVDLLQNPARLRSEYERRLKSKSKDDPAKLEQERKSVQNKIARMIDSYADGIINKAEFEPRVKRAKNQLKAIEEQERKLAEQNQNSQQLELLIVRIDEFAAKLTGKLLDVDWETKREIIRSVIRRVEIDQDEVNVVFRVTSFPFELAPSGAKGLQHCRKRAIPISVQCDT
ncbi:MAG: recombinase family protein [Candidatus Obscuribacterales bacterium]|nr:recombinase family protein [Candidatus Obscuribacterales bacterium]